MDEPPPPVGNARVVARFRPLSRAEMDSPSSGHSIINSIDACSCVVSTPLPASAGGGGGGGGASAAAAAAGAYPFTFDAVFSSSAQQSEVYQSVGLPLVRSFLGGYNGCLLAYGQTGSGKTHTMFGPDDLLAALSSVSEQRLSEEEARELEESAGIVPRCVQDLFEAMAQLQQAEALDFHLEVSACEIYNETVKDALDASNPEKQNLPIVTGADGSPEVRNLTRLTVRSPLELIDCVREGLEARRVAATSMNERSSRSHLIFILRLTRSSARAGTHSLSTLYLADLAGSEMVGKTGVTGRQLKEAGAINTSLTTLGLVINKLTSKASSHIPYRDSKLTRLLETSLGGNSTTALLITCSPSADNFSETLSTLRFGARAKAIEQRAQVSLVVGPEELARQVEALRSQLGVAQEVLGELRGLAAGRAIVNSRRTGGRDLLGGLVARSLALSPDAGHSDPRLSLGAEGAGAAAAGGSSAARGKGLLLPSPAAATPSPAATSLAKALSRTSNSSSNSSSSSSKNSSATPLAVSPQAPIQVSLSSRTPASPQQQQQQQVQNPAASGLASIESAEDPARRDSAKTSSTSGSEAAACTPQGPTAAAPQQSAAAPAPSLQAAGGGGGGGAARIMGVDGDSEAEGEEEEEEEEEDDEEDDEEEDEEPGKQRSGVSSSHERTYRLLIGKLSASYESEKAEKLALEKELASARESLAAAAAAAAASTSTQSPLRQPLAPAPSPAPAAPSPSLPPLPPEELYKVTTLLGELGKRDAYIRELEGRVSAEPAAQRSAVRSQLGSSGQGLVRPHSITVSRSELEAQGGGRASWGSDEAGGGSSSSSAAAPANGASFTEQELREAAALASARVAIRGSVSSTPARSATPVPGSGLQPDAPPPTPRSPQPAGFLRKLLSGLAFSAAPAAAPPQPGAAAAAAAAAALASGQPSYLSRLVLFFSACEQGNLEGVQRLLAGDARQRAAEAAAEAAAGQGGPSPGPAPTVPFPLARDRAGRSAMHYAARGGHLHVLQCLREAGGDVDALDRDARGGIFYAARRGHVNVCSFFLRCGSGQQRQDVHGLSPLHQAVLARSAPCVALLLAAGADACLRDLNGLSAYKLAKRFISPDSYQESRQVILLLQQHIVALPEEKRALAGLTPARLPHASPSAAASGAAQ